MIASSIDAGDRSFSSLRTIPDLPSAGFAAIQQMGKEGLVEASFADDRVEPTAAFWPWLEVLRRQEQRNAELLQENSSVSQARQAQDIITRMKADRCTLRKLVGRIAGGERSRRAVFRSPDFTNQTFKTMCDLTWEGLVKTDILAERMEPTPLFWPVWEQLKAADVQQGSTAVEPVQLASNGVPAAEKPSPRESRLRGEVSSQAEVTPSLAFKPRRPRVKRPDLLLVDRMCVKIILCMRHKGHRLSLSDLKRGVSANRDKETFKLAMERLQNLRALRVEKVPGSRRRWVILLEIPKRYEEARPKPKRRRHPRHSRGQTEWFKKLIADEEED